MNRTTRLIFVVLLCIVLLPALFYSVYEITTLNETEEILNTVYSRQLDAILFSVNQYILDVSSGWASQIERELSGQFKQLLKSNPSLESIIIADTSLQTIVSVPSSRFSAAEVLTPHRAMIERLLRYQEASYRKLEPIMLSDSLMMLVFIPSSQQNRVAGIVVNTRRFIADVIGRKLFELSRNDFILAVVYQPENTIVFSTVADDTADFVQQRQLWIYPDYIVKIKLMGTTVQQLADERFNRNLVLIIVLDLVLIVGAWFVFRIIKKEMELVALKSDFVSNVSHELRTPLALIRMFTETLEMGRVKTEKKKKEYYAVILHETERLTRLINNILNFSRMELHSRKFNFRQSDVNEVVRSVLAIYSYHFEQLKFRVETSLDKKLPPATIDDEAIAEALHNLIDNAIKYSDKEKYLRLTTSSDGNNILLCVEDRGIGISRDHHEKIFEKFYRVSQGLVHTTKGSGLGLAIVQHIVESHGGSIAVESSVGKGSKFVITLPINTQDRS
jgi:two-component system phosphate regulon sensor histidine kinase PhoR